MNGMRRVPAGRAGSVIGVPAGSGRCHHHCGSPMEARRAHRDRTVYVAEAFR